MRWLLRRRPVQFLVYVLFRFASIALTVVPYSSASSIARAIRTPVMWVDRRHRTIAEANLSRTGFGNISSMVRKMYQHFAQVAIELFHVPRLLSRGHLFPRVVKFQGLEIVDRLLLEGKGQIWAISHVGNYELTGLAVCAAGYRIHSLAQRVQNPYIDRWLMAIRQCTGQRIIRKVNARAAMADVLKNNGILVIQVDQAAGPNEEWIPFFGIPASTVRSPALFSLRYGAPIVPLNMYRERSLHHGVFSAPIYPDAYRGKPDAVRAITEVISAHIEEFVRMHPEQWNWLHRRWKTWENQRSKTRLARDAEGSALR